MRLRILIPLLLSSLAAATTVVPMSVERLTQASSRVVVGQAEDSWTEWNPQHTIIYTKTRFRVTDTLKGEAATTIVVKQLGGRAAHYEQKVDGVRPLNRGESAVLFVHPSQSNDGTEVITGLMQGNFRLMRSKTGELIVNNGVSDVKRYDPTSQVVTEFSGARMTLQQLVSKVRKASAQ